MKKLKQIINEQMVDQKFDLLSVGVIDFNKNIYNISEYGGENIYFDLASITKPFTLFLSYCLHPNFFSDKEFALLNHRSGLPSGGRLSQANWKEQIQSYPIVVGSQTNYSDFGPLRLMLELINKTMDFEKEIKDYWQNDLYYWKELPSNLDIASTGIRNKCQIQGVVQDHNAFVLDQFCSHSGAFASVEGVCRFLLRLNKDFQFLNKVSFNPDQRFTFGWDQGTEPDKSLAGHFKHQYTFGHLGFTGTSVWIDPIEQKGHVLLSNGCLNGWYDRVKLNRLRRHIGTHIWNNYEFN